MDQKQLSYFIAVAKYRNFSPGGSGFLSDTTRHQPPDKNVGKGTGYGAFCPKH